MIFRKKTHEAWKYILFSIFMKRKNIIMTFNSLSAKASASVIRTGSGVPKPSMRYPSVSSIS